MSGKIKVLIVDDSALVRKVFSDIINQDPSLEVIGIAQNGKIALNKIPQLQPDIITLDIEMPEIDGFGVLKELVNLNSSAKVIMVSGLTSDGARTTLKALEMGAVDFIEKPSGRSVDLKVLSESLLNKIHTIAKIDVKRIGKRVVEPVSQEPVKKIIGADKIPTQFVAIGTSTGGPNALKEVFSNREMPGECAYLIVQHMPKEFTGPFAERLNAISQIYIKEAENNEPILSGHAYIAPGDSHLEIIYRNDKPIARLSQTGKVSGHMPSIDVLFNSVASCCANKTVAVIMTGMGKDGANGIKSIKNMGGKTIAQDKESSVVFGMNKEAIELNAIDIISPLKQISQNISSLTSRK